MLIHTIDLLARRQDFGDRGRGTRFGFVVVVVVGDETRLKPFDATTAQPAFAHLIQESGIRGIVLLTKDVGQEDLMVLRKGVGPLFRFETEFGRVVCFCCVVVVLKTFVDGGQLQEIAREDELNATKGLGGVAPEAPADGIQEVEELLRHHADFVDHQDIRLSPVLALVGGHAFAERLGGLVAQADVGPGMEGLRVAIQEQGGAARHGTHLDSPVVTGGCGVLIDLVDEGGFAGATGTCDKYIVAGDVFIEGALLRLGEHFFLVPRLWVLVFKCISFEIYMAAGKGRSFVPTGEKGC